MSFYITCTHCGSHNEIQSEYLTFCVQCKKKLPTNYREWTKENPDRSFEEYKKEVGVELSSSELENKSDTSKSNVISIYLKIGLVFVSLSGLLFFLYPKLITESQLIIYLKSIIQDKKNTLTWQSKTYGDYGLQFDSPVELKQIKVNFPPDLAPLLLDIQIFASDFNQDIALMCISNKFRNNTVDVHLESSVTRFIDQIRKLNGIDDFIIQQKETSLGGYEGFKQTGQFTRNGQLKGFESIGVGEGQYLWQIMIVYNIHNEQLNEAKERILKSVKITYNRSI